MKKLISTFLFFLVTLALSYTSFAEESIRENPDISIVIDGKAGSYSAVPIEVNGRTLLPLREVLVNLGVQNDNSHIIWNDSEQSVSILKDNTRIYLKIGSSKAKINDRDITLSAAPVMYNDRTYIPARFVAESLGRKVAWDGELQKVLITDDENFNKINSILSNAGKKMDSVTKYKISQTLITEIKALGHTEVANIKAEHKIDQKNMLVLGNLSINGQSGSTKEGFAYELFGDGSVLYSRENAASKWEKAELTDLQLEDENTKIFDAYYFLRPSEALCAAVVEEKSSNSNEILIKGNTFPHELMSMMIRNSALLKKEFFRDSEVEIVIDKTTGVFKSIKVKSKSVSAISQINFDGIWENSEIDGSFQISVPSDLKTLAALNSDVTNGEKQMDISNYEEAIRYFDKALQADPKLTRAISGKSIALYYLGKYNESIEYIDKYITYEANNSDSYVWKAKNQIQLRQNDKAIECCNKALEIDSENPFAYNVKSLALRNKRNFNEALNSVNKAIELDEEYADAYSSKVSILFYSKKYDECIEFAKKAQLIDPNDVDIPWFKGDSYSFLRQYDNAIKAYQEALTLDPKNDYIISNIGWGYYYLENYSKAEEYLEKALKLNSDNDDALELKEYLKQAKLPEGQKVVDFVKTNYLYFDKIAGFDEKSGAILSKTNVSAQDATNYINSIKLKDDIFTFVLSGKDYEEYINWNDSNNVSCKKLSDNNYYIRISDFNAGVANEVRKYIDTINNTETANLIIDLRDNGGGLTQASNEILDYLLPQCTTSFMINRDGQIYPYYSDENQIKFKKIIILVNEYSASSSELLTLGLKKYLNNVVIVGKPTFGKGVGQYVYEDKTDKYAVFLVSFYWNVKEQNIMGSKITPDVTVKGSSGTDYFNEISKLK